MSDPLFRFIHISDLHYTCMPSHIREFFNKRIIGITNFLLKRRKDHSETLLEAIFPLLHIRDFDAVIISGDFTSTSLPSEFTKAKKFVSELEQNNYTSYLIPGNHDCYTHTADEEKRYYQFFPDSLPQSEGMYSLKKDRIAFGRFTNDLYWVALDTATSTSFFDSTGFFSEQMEKKLRDVLTNHIPQDKLTVMLNHYPLYPPRGLKEQHRSLRRAEALQHVLKDHQNVKLYLHGHNHEHKVINKQAKNLPVTVDAGSVSTTNKGSWLYQELYHDRVEITPYFWDNEDLLMEKKWLEGEKEVVHFRS